MAADSVSVGEGGAGGVPQPATTRANRMSAVKQSRGFFIVDFPLPRSVGGNWFVDQTEVHPDRAALRNKMRNGIKPFLNCSRE